MTEFNIRLLGLKVIELEERLARLEAVPHEVAPITGLFTIESRGPKWFCMAPDGVKVNERGLTREEAQALADEMNGVTKSMLAA